MSGWAMRQVERMERDLEAVARRLDAIKIEFGAIAQAARSVYSIPTEAPVPTVDTPCCSNVPLTLYVKRRTTAFELTYNSGTGRWQVSGFDFRCATGPNRWVLEDLAEDRTIVWSSGEYTCPAECPTKTVGGSGYTVSSTPFP